jgi:predicted hydrolase (HD superfamily)
MPTREDAVRTLEDWVSNPALRAHMYAVEAAVRAYARRMGEDEDTWGLAGLLHELDRTLVACDELTGLINATALVRPTGIDDLKPKSVKKKMKDATFARGVDRDDIRRGAELLEVELDAHIQTVIEAMREIAGDLGITGDQIGRKG